MTRTILHRLATLALAVVLAACGGDSAKEQTPKTVSKWPALAELDEATHRLAASADNAPKDQLVASMEAWGEAAAKVVAEKPPAELANPEKVNLLLRDIRSLSNSMAAAKGMPEDFARKMAKGLQPAVHELMEAAGMPHVHGADDHSGHDHDHGDHDGHDHSDHDHSDHDHSDHEGHDHSEHDGHAH